MPSTKKNNGEDVRKFSSNVRRVQTNETTKSDHLKSLLKTKLKACRNLILNEYLLNFCNVISNRCFRQKQTNRFIGGSVRSVKTDIESVERMLYERLREKKLSPMKTFIQNPNKSSPQYYAGYLWNYRLETCNKKKKYEHLKTTIFYTLHYMNPNDIQLIKNLIMERFFRLFPQICKIHNFFDIKTYLQEKLKRLRCALILKRVIHKWFLMMPLLREIEKYTGWEFIMTNKAFMLDTDTLYNVLLNVTYNNKKV